MQVYIGKSITIHNMPNPVTIFLTKPAGKIFRLCTYIMGNEPHDKLYVV